MSLLLQEIRKRIRREGPLTFAEYMKLALYHPALGYYSSRVPRAGGDYRTSPAITGTFGLLIARVLRRMWLALGEPNSFTIVEVGGGGGDLAAAAIAALPDSLRGHTIWRFVEPFEKVRSLQAERLQDLPVRVEWSSHLNEPPAVGCVIANEVLDNFPVHVYEVASGGASEVHVDVEGDRLVETLGEPSAGSSVPYLHETLGHLDDGDRFEARPGVEDWCRQAAGALERGYLLVIDYGDTTPDLWIKRPAGTIVTYRDEMMGLDPLSSPGEFDITAHVDFSALQEAATRADLSPLMLLSQRDFLESMGISEIATALRRKQQKAQEAGDNMQAMHILGERGRIQTLTARGGLGDLLVFLAAKNAPAI